MFSFLRKNKVIGQIINNTTKDSQIALLTINGNIRNQIMDVFNRNFITDGIHIKNGGKVSPKTMISLIGSAGGSLGLAGLASGQLFMATANPATLMQIGSGVGSAVMGAGGIVAQAPFIPIAGALMPVVAPLIAFQTISTVMIMNEFKAVNKKLDQLQESINNLIIRSESMFLGEIINAANIITDLENQYSDCNQFTDSMIIRLSLIEQKTNSLFERYNYLYSKNILDKAANIDNVRIRNADACMAILASILDIRIDILKMKLYIQENPGYIKESVLLLKNKIKDYSGLWGKIKKDPETMNTLSEQMTTTVDEMNWWESNMPEWLGGKLKEREGLEKKANALENESLRHQINFRDFLDTTNNIKEHIDNVNNVDLVYWQDKSGEYCYYTSDLGIKFEN